MKDLSPYVWAPVAVVGASLMLSGCIGGGNTYGTGVSPGAQTVKDLMSVIPVGRKKPDPIDYEARPPIVAPPAGATLPPPTDGAAAASADWPQDPNELDEQYRARVKTANKDNDPNYDPGFRLPKKEIQREASDTPNITKSELDYQEFLQNRKEKKKLYADAKADAKGTVDEFGNPVRKTLSQPPVEYMEPDPEAPDEFTAKKKKKKKSWWPF